MGHTNYLTAHKNSVGVANFKQYLLPHDRRTRTDWLLPDEEKADGKKTKSKAKYRAMKELLAQEKEETKKLGS